MLWKRLALLVAAMVTALVLASGVALAVVKIGGPGDDTLVGTEGRDLLKGKAGDDRLFGLGGNDRSRVIANPYFCRSGKPRGGLYGGTGGDSLNGGSGMDELYGGDGSDNIKGEKGVDHAFGGAGSDTVDLDVGGVADSFCWASDPRTQEYAEGGHGSDVMHGGTGRDMMDGDVLLPDFSGFGYWRNDPQGGPDKVYGDEGKDEVWGSTGTDRVYGGPGNDIVDDYETTITNKDYLYGGSGNDLMREGPHPFGYLDPPPFIVVGNVFEGGEGNDRILTSAGNPRSARSPDYLYGGPGDDTINSATPSALTGKDWVYCGSGYDKAIADADDRVADDCENVIRR